MPYYVFALTAAVIFSLLIHLQRIYAAGTDGLKGATISVVSTAIFFWAISPLTVEPVWWQNNVIWIFAACGLMFPAMGQLMQILAIQRVGPNVTASVGAFMPIFAITPALFFLGERLGAQGVVGLTILIAGLLIAAYPGRGRARDQSLDWPLIFLIFPLGAAMARGITQPLSKFGYTILPEPSFATMIMATVSSGVLILMMLFRREPRSFAVTWSARHTVFFAVNGILNGIGILCLQQSLNIGDVSRTAPLVAMSPLITWIMSALFFRSQNAGWRHFVMAALVVVGGILVVTRP